MTRRRRTIPELAAWLVLFLVPATGGAQLSTAIDGGWATVHYDEYLRSSVLTLSPTLRLEYPRTVFATRGTLSFFESGSRSLDLTLAASTFSAARGPFRLEISGGGGGTLYNGIGTGHLSAGLRVHALGRRTGAWAGGSGGYVDDGIVGVGMARYSAGAWMRLGGMNISGGATHLDAELVSVTDIESAIRFSRGPANLSVSGGFRMGAGDLVGARRWGEFSGIFWLSPHVAMIAAHGRYPSEPGRGTPGGRYTTFSLRFSSRAPLLDVAIPRRDRGEGAATSRPVVASFQVKKQNDSLHTLTVRAPGARALEITGDFTDWQPQTMERKGNGDNFIYTVTLAPGSYKFKVRSDGGSWGVPPGMPLLRDELAGEVAVLLVSR